ncbi:MAG: TIGR01458 family HAD-type hydrolase [Planctomycetota bacterium]
MKEARPITGVLLDISGVLLIDGRAVPGAADAIAQLIDFGLPYRFATNTTRRPPVAMVRRLNEAGIAADEASVFSAPRAAKDFIAARGLRPWLLVHPELRDHFAGLAAETPDASDAVLVGDAGDGFTYAAMNQAFNVLMNSGGPLLAMGVNRYFRHGDGALALDAGPFVRALEDGAGITAQVLGKPARAFFEAAATEMGVALDGLAMIGDDVRDDVGGAQAHGLVGVLVRSGKYTDGDEGRIDPPPAACVRDIREAVACILERTRSASA